MADNWFLEALQPALKNVLSYLGGGQQQQPNNGNVLEAIVQQQQSGHTPGFQLLKDVGQQTASTVGNAIVNPIQTMDEVAAAVAPYAREGATNTLPAGFRDMGKQLYDNLYDKAKYYSRNPYEAASDLTQLAWDTGPGQALQGSRQMYEAVTGDKTGRNPLSGSNDDGMTSAQRFAKALEGGLNVAGGGIPGMDDLVMKGAPMAMLIGQKSGLWKKLAALGPYDNVPLGAYSSRYFEPGAGPQVEVFNPTSLSSQIDDLQAKRGKIMEMISPTADKKQYEGRMKDLVKDPVGYAAYPESAHNPVSLALDRKASSASGATYPAAFDPGSPSMMSNKIETTAPDKEQLLKAIIHEKSHPRGRAEWGAVGGDPIGSGSMETYLARPGEIYARTEANTANVLPEQRAADINKGMWPNTGTMWVGDKQVPVKPFWDYADMPPELSGLSVSDLSKMQQAIAKGRATPEQKQMDQLLKMLMK